MGLPPGGSESTAVTAVRSERDSALCSSPGAHLAASHLYSSAMNKIVIAPQGFKENLTGIEIARG
ncbi:MAG: hypothetical protein O3C69_03945, partial [Chloroflexi bacterium]|nr:hypothetical protein [Chloroflexota bacterium]